MCGACFATLTHHGSCGQPLLISMPLRMAAALVQQCMRGSRCQGRQQCSTHTQCTWWCVCFKDTATMAERRPRQQPARTATLPALQSCEGGQLSLLLSLLLLFDHCFWFCSAPAAAAAPPALLLTNKSLPGMAPNRQFQGVPRTDAIGNYFVLMKVRSGCGSCV